METSHFYSIWKTSRPKNTRISFLYKTFQKTIKIPESEFYTLKIRRAYLSLCHGNATPPQGGNINYSIHMQKLCFLYDEKAVPASRSKVWEDKKIESPTFGKTALIHHTKEINNIKNQSSHKGISEKLLKTGDTNLLLGTHLCGIWCSLNWKSTV